MLLILFEKLKIGNTAKAKAAKKKREEAAKLKLTVAPLAKSTPTPKIKLNTSIRANSKAIKPLEEPSLSPPPLELVESTAAPYSSLEPKNYKKAVKENKEEEEVIKLYYLSIKLEIYYNRKCFYLEIYIKDLNNYNYY